jgi:hypothetical protein
VLTGTSVDVLLSVILAAVCDLSVQRSPCRPTLALKSFGKNRVMMLSPCSRLLSHSLTLTLSLTLAHSFTLSLSHSLTLSRIHSVIRSFSCSLNHSVSHILLVPSHFSCTSSPFQKTRCVHWPGRLALWCDVLLGVSLYHCVLLL